MEIENIKKLGYKSIPIICGPTASGKSSLALNLCKQLNGELISMDSMQIYKGLDIGTAKPTKEEQIEVKHHLIDIISPDEKYSVAEYQKQSYIEIEDCLARGVLPVFCGGTGQYAAALADGTIFAPVKISDEIKNEINNRFENDGIEPIYTELQICDPVAAKKIHPNNTKRVIRALQIYKQTGKTQTEYNKESKREGARYPFSLFAIQMDRNVLYERINERVDMMIEDGLKEEFLNIINSGISSDATALQAIGYKELLMWHKGEMSFDNAVNLLKQKTRNYAKRQLTWFRNTENINWIEPHDIESVINIIKV